MANPKNTAPATAPAAPATAPVQLIRVTLPATFKAPRASSARGQYLARLQAHNGKPLAAFIASVAANPPSTPTKGKLAGKPEPVQGWVSWFTRQGVLTLIAGK